MKKNLAQLFPFLQKDNKNRIKINHNPFKPFDQINQVNSLKARSFLQNKKTFDDPNTTFTIMDQIKEQAQTFLKENPGRLKKSHNQSKFNQNNLDIKKQMSSVHQKSQSKNKYAMNKTFLPHLTSQLFVKKPKFKIQKEREQIIDLAKWIDSKLQTFRKNQKICIDDILNYKQTVVNYGLGKIISNVTKKCKEQGQLLEAVWDNTFAIFQCLLSSVAQIGVKKQQESLTSQKQQLDIFNSKLKYEEQKMKKVIDQNQFIFDKMKSVIKWNKQLRKQRKQQFIQNKILNFRLETYIDGLEQSIQLLLRSTPQSKNIAFAKKILQKLAIQKRRKKKKLGWKKQTFQQYYTDIKTMVYNWLKRNSFEHSDEQLKILYETFNHEDFINLEQIQDKSNMKAVNIQDYFKLIDIGFQTHPEMMESQAQCEIAQYKSIYVATDHVNKLDKAIQTKGVTMQFDYQYEQENYQKKTIPSSKHIKSKSFKKSYKNINEKHQNRTKNNGKLVQQKQVLNSSQNRFKNTSLKQLNNITSHQKLSSRGQDKYQTYSPDDFMRGQSSYSFQDEQVQGQGQGYSSFKSFKKQPSLFNNYDDTKKSQFSSIFNFQRGRGVQIKNHERSSFARPIKRLNSVNFHTPRHFQIGLFQQNELNLEYGKKFNDQYIANKALMNRNKQKFMKGIQRRRSFHRQSTIMYPNQKLMQQKEIDKKILFICGGVANNRLSEINYSNAIDSKLDKISKKTFTGSNLTKAKAFQNSNQTFQNVAQAVYQNKINPPPKNKQFCQASIASLTKKIYPLFEDYLKQLRREKDGISVDFGKIYYPLRILLVEQKGCKYGLRDIAEKKLKDFIQKLVTFAQTSKKIELFGKLLGLQDEATGADELMLHLKCLVYYDLKSNYLNAMSQVNKVLVQSDVLYEFLPKVTQGFFNNQQLPDIVKKLDNLYTSSPNNISIEDISILLIDNLLRKKNEQRQKYVKFYEFLAQGNFFSNLYTFINMIKILGINKNLNIQKCLQQFFRKADIMDEVYGKTISENRFILCCIILQIPKFNQVNEAFEKWRCKILSNLGNNQSIFQTYSLQNYRKVIRMAQSWKLNEQYQRFDDPLRWKWFTNKILFNRIQTNVLKTMGNLTVWNNQINQIIR